MQVYTQQFLSSEATLCCHVIVVCLWYKQKIAVHGVSMLFCCPQWFLAINGCRGRVDKVLMDGWIDKLMHLLPKTNKNNVENVMTIWHLCFLCINLGNVMVSLLLLRSDAFICHYFSSVQWKYKWCLNLIVMYVPIYSLSFSIALCQALFLLSKHHRLYLSKAQKLFFAIF